jgi:CelD/BcsL family acetyltransferase involved in cellulose biosynthesis
MFEWLGYRDFFIDIACNARRSGLVHVSTVSAGEQIVAANFALTFHGNYDYVLAGYDDGETAACSPGTIHLQELMRYCTERNFKTFDFNIGDEPYKHEWFDTEVKLFDHVVPMTLRGWGAMALMRSLRMLKRFIKHHPSIWPAIRRARSIVGGLRR